MSQSNKYRNYLVLTLLIIVLGIVSLQAINYQQANKQNYQSNSTESIEYSNSALQQRISTPPMPLSLTFAGEAINLNDPEFKERLEKEILVNTFKHSATILIIKKKKRIFDIIEPILQEYNIPEDFKYLAIAESALDPTATSTSNAKGIWQFLSGTGKERGLEINSEVDERMNIEKSTIAACKYLQDAYVRNGSWINAAASYNMGMTGFKNYATAQNQDDYTDIYMHDEPYRYVARILSFKIILTNPEAYGYYLGPDEKYESYNNTFVDVNSSVNWVDFAKKYGSNYKMLRWQNPWIVGNKLTNSSGKTYKVRIPN